MRKRDTRDIYDLLAEDDTSLLAKIPERLKKFNVDPDWHERRKENFEEMKRLRASAANMWRKLVAIDGWDVVNNFTEQDEKNIVRRGALLKPKKVSNIRGAHYNDCHTGSLAHWKQHPDRLILYTGAYMGKNGMWRPHSWNLDPATNTIIEATPNRGRLYFGYALTRKEAEQAATQGWR